jgi:hypothetical protein
MDQWLTRNGVTCTRSPGGVRFAIKTHANQTSDEREILKTRYNNENNAYSERYNNENNAYND